MVIKANSKLSLRISKENGTLKWYIRYTISGEDVVHSCSIEEDPHFYFTTHKDVVNGEHIETRSFIIGCDDELVENEHYIPVSAPEQKFPSNRWKQYSLQAWRNAGEQAMKEWETKSNKEKFEMADWLSWHYHEMQNSEMVKDGDWRSMWTPSRDELMNMDFGTVRMLYNYPDYFAEKLHPTRFD